ncbi:BON domain-containing protein [Pusillimonas noertemannii]|uniref:Osmotically-inducible protein OsmY n=1 Tax=Pusillimonas noertemannii TaxID=305977 RepID=A0A2U1CN71_9BURK|nr:BON domain-containing protein [Pusillimonas noertemannii]NYT68517.1 BON domain-containing protein [Pusillimonas noertemannii]PVY62466.1 osmotically-inducible protein OsmY [Pusillimonas noertemannii]
MAMNHRLSKLLLVTCIPVVSLVALSGCAPLVVGGAAATTAVVATDRRTAGEQVEDQAIEMKVGAEMRKLVGDKGRVNTIAYAGNVLLTGDVPTEQDKQQAEQLASKVEKVKRVYNQLRVGDITSINVRTNDSWLSTKVTTTLINTKDVPTRTIVVSTERGVVYLMGRVTEAESERAGKAAAGVSGINKVVKLFEIVSPESLATDTSAAPVQESSAPAAGTQPDSGSAEVQTMPVQ